MSIQSMQPVSQIAKSHVSPADSQSPFGTAWKKSFGWKLLRIEFGKFGSIEDPRQGLILCLPVLLDMTLADDPPEIFATQFPEIRRFNEQSFYRAARFKPDLKYLVGRILLLDNFLYLLVRHPR